MDGNPESFAGFKRIRIAFQKIVSERLIESGFMTMVNVRNRITEREEAHPRVDPEIVAQIIEAYHGLVRLAHQTTGEESLSL